MKLGVMTVCLSSLSLDEACRYLKEQGVQQVEIGCGGSPGTAHCDARKMAGDPAAADEFAATVAKHGLTLSAFAVHGNPLHPDQETAGTAHAEFEAAVLLAERLGVKTVITFSGCPGDCETSKYPNWAVATWPEDYEKIRRWQWEEKLIPYWKRAGAFAKAHHVRVALEIHPGFCVYNVPTMLRLREAVGDAVGANLDPSHLFWQGVDPVAAVHALRGCIYHFHAKDTYIDPYNTAVNGVLHTSGFADTAARPWLFRTVGYGHGAQTWRAIFSALQQAGYDGVISIEHEDALMSQKEGLEKAIRVLRDTMIFDAPTADVYWA